MDKIRTALIGCGKVGHTHARALKKIPLSNFVAVCDNDIERAKSFAAEYGVKAYSDIDEMFAQSKAEAVCVCTPHPVHAGPVVRALNAGVHAIVEKPLASTLEDCDAMIQAAEANKVILSTMCQRRFYPQSMRIRKAIDDGRIGKPILGTVTMHNWRDSKYYASDPWRGTWMQEGGGVLVNQAPHQIDLLQWYMGPVDELFGFWSNLTHPFIEVEDTAVAVIKFKNGAIGNIVLSNCQNPALYGNVHVFGENGASVGVQTESGAMFIAGMSTIADPPVNDLWTVQGETELIEKWKAEDLEFFGKIDATEYFHQLQIEDFLNAIVKGTKPLIDGADGRRTVEIFTAIYRSNRDQKPVKFPLEPEYAKDMDGRLK